MIRHLALLSISALLLAGEAPPDPAAKAKAEAAFAILAGAWEVDGLVSADKAATVSPSQEMPKMQATIAPGSITLRFEPESQLKILCKPLAITPEGLEITASGGFWGGREASTGLIVVYKDSLVFCQNAEFRHGFKLHRSDGKPVGLPPSVLPSEAKPVVPVIAAGDTPAGFAVQLQSLTIGSEVNFQEGRTEEPRFSSSSCLNLQIVVPAGVKVVNDPDQVTLSEASTDAGESLIPATKKDDNGMGGRHHFGRRGISMDNNRLWVRQELGPNTRPVRSLKRLAGTIPLECEKTAGALLELKGVATAVGKELAIPDTDSSVILLAVEGSKLKYRVPSKAKARIRNIELVTASGGELESNSSSSSSDGRTTTEERTFNEPIPADAILQVQLIGETMVVNVPFEFKDVPLVEQAPATNPKAMF